MGTLSNGYLTTLYIVESGLDVDSQISKLENGLLLIIRGPTSYKNDYPRKNHDPTLQTFQDSPRIIPTSRLATLTNTTVTTMIGRAGLELGNKNTLNIYFMIRG